MSEEKPTHIWVNGKILPWEEGKIHLWSEVAIRGASVFDGIRTFWSEEDGVTYALSLEEHLRRLEDSARILRIPTPYSSSEMATACGALIERLGLRENSFLRPTFFIEEGRYGYRPEDTLVGAYIVAFPMPRAQNVFDGIRCGVSSWQRASDLVSPPRVKAGAFYLNYRLARIEAMEHGYDDLIILNSRGTVSETSGAALFIKRGDQVVTPPLTADILESVTRRKIMELLKGELGITVIEREVNRTELYVADEIFACGTIVELQPVIEIDGRKIGTGTPGPLTTQVRDRYFEICDMGSQAPKNWLEELPG